jgi:hypothetical protein
MEQLDRQASSLIVQCKDTSDVVSALRFVRENAFRYKPTQALARVCGLEEKKYTE